MGPLNSEKQSFYLLGDKILTYQPKPIDTDNITLTTEHLKITDLLAKNTHEIWAEQRIADGWKYGKKRDDTKKEHPCLVPYEELSESEKEYDRRTALGAIKTFLALDKYELVESPVT